MAMYCSTAGSTLVPFPPMIVAEAEKGLAGPLCQGFEWKELAIDPVRAIGTRGQQTQ